MLHLKQFGCGDKIQYDFSDCEEFRLSRGTACIGHTYPTDSFTSHLCPLCRHDARGIDRKRPLGMNWELLGAIEMKDSTEEAHAPDTHIATQSYPQNELQGNEDLGIHESGRLTPEERTTQREYTRAENDWILNRYRSYALENQGHRMRPGQLTEEFNEEFPNVKRTEQALSYHIRFNEGLKSEKETYRLPGAPIHSKLTPDTRREYTREQDDWILERHRSFATEYEGLRIMPAQLTEEYNQEFPNEQRTKNALMCHVNTTKLLQSVRESLTSYIGKPDQHKTT